MSRETLSKKPPILHISLEGYISTADAEFLDKFKQELLGRGLDTNDLIFSGFDGSFIESGEDDPRHSYVFGMNEAGWREALRDDEVNPARYAENYAIPCIGIYDKNLLSEAYSYDHKGDPLEARLELTDIIVGNALRDTEPDEAINGAIVHLDYPEGSPADALVGLVRIDP
jgi:hypothetical protein